jgi:hypothetical protein
MAGGEGMRAGVRLREPGFFRDQVAGRRCSLILVRKPSH